MIVTIGEIQQPIADDLDEACLPLGSAADAAAFVEACGALRYWPRELEVDLDAKPDKPQKPLKR